MPPRFLALLLLPLVALACSTPTPQTDVRDLRLIRKGSGYPEVSGYLVNDSDATISSADVFITLYDANHVPIEGDPFYVTVEDVAPGDSARFVRRLDVAASGASVKYVAAN